MQLSSIIAARPPCTVPAGFRWVSLGTAVTTTRPFSASMRSYPKIWAIVLSGNVPFARPWTNSRPAHLLLPVGADSPICPAAVTARHRFIVPGIEDEEMPRFSSLALPADCFLIREPRALRGSASPSSCRVQKWTARSLRPRCASFAPRARRASPRANARRFRDRCGARRQLAARLYGKMQPLPWVSANLPAPVK